MKIKVEEGGIETEYKKSEKNKEQGNDFVAPGYLGSSPSSLDSIVFKL